MDAAATRIIRVPFKAWMAMERVMGEPQKVTAVNSDWIRTPRVKGGRLRRRVFVRTDDPVPPELEDEL